MKKLGADRDKWMNFFKDFKKTVDTIHELFTKVTYDDFILRYPKASTNPGVSYRYIDALKSLLRVKNKSWVLPIFTILNYELSINESNESFINDNFHN